MIALEPFAHQPRQKRHAEFQCSIKRDGDHCIVDGRKWFSSGAGSLRCKIFIVMGKTDPDAPRHAKRLTSAAGDGLSQLTARLK